MSKTAVSGNGAPPRRVPTAHSVRWKPMRSGFLNIYKYDREEFHYENGRLLLRGNNGTGKSRANPGRLSERTAFTRRSEHTAAFLPRPENTAEQSINPCSGWASIDIRRCSISL